MRLALVLTAERWPFVRQAGTPDDIGRTRFCAGLRDGEARAQRAAIRAVAHCGYDLRRKSGCPGRPVFDRAQERARTVWIILAGSGDGTATVALRVNLPVRSTDLNAGPATRGGCDAPGKAGHAHPPHRADRRITRHRGAFTSILTP